MKTNWLKFDPILPDILNVMTYIVFLTKQEAMYQQKGWRIFFLNEKLNSPLEPGSIIAHKQLARSISL